MDLYGRVLSVDTRNVGEPTTTSHAIGDYLINVLDAGTFDETGGIVNIEGVLYPFIETNSTLDTILLMTELEAAIEDGALVEAYPPAPEKIALVDLGGDGDAVPCVVPHELVEALPDGVRTEDEQETVICTTGEGGYLVELRSIVGQPLTPSAIDASRLSVGVVGNLVQDPQLATDRVADQPWQIAGPDPAYPEFRFARCLSRDGLEAEFFVTDRFPIEAGSTVRFSAFVRSDIYATTFTAELMADFYDDEGELVDSDSESVVPEDLTPGAWSALNGAYTAPDGAVWARARYVVTDQTAGYVDFVKPSVTVLWNRIQSTDYLEGESGWNFDDEVAQVDNLNVLGELGAGAIAADSIMIAGEDIVATAQDRARGSLSYARVWGTDTGDIAGTETLLFEFNAGPVQLGRLYRIHVHGQIDNTVTTDTFDMRLRYTTNDTAPTTASSILDGSLTRIGAGNSSTAYNVWSYYSPQQDWPTLRASLTLKRASGSGTGKITLTDVNKATEFQFEDLGAFTGSVASLGGGVLQQVSKTSGGIDGVAKQRYTKSYPATWGRSYDGDLGTRAGAATDDLYFGFYDSTHGWTRSLFGFDDALIRADLDLATIVACSLKFRVKHTFYNAGAGIYLGSANYSSPPITWSAVTTDRIHWANLKEGSVYSKALPTAIGNEFASGATRCLAWGPGPTRDRAYYGRMYGPNSIYEPVLTITYTK